MKPIRGECPDDALNLRNAEESFVDHSNFLTGLLERTIPVNETGKVLHLVFYGVASSTPETGGFIKGVFGGSIGVIASKGLVLVGIRGVLALDGDSEGFPRHSAWGFIFVGMTVGLVQRVCRW